MTSGKLKGGGVYAFLGVSSPFDPDCTFVTSPALPSFLLAAVRLVIALYALFVVLFSLIWGAVKSDDAQTYVLPDVVYDRLLISVISNIGTFPSLRTSPI